MPGNYKKGSEDWVTNFVIGFGNTHYTDANGLSLWEALTQSLGGDRSGNRNLALVEKGINGYKGTFFALSMPRTGINPASKIRTKIDFIGVSTDYPFVHSYVSMPY